MIQCAEQMKVHTMLVIIKRDMETYAVSVGVHGKGILTQNRAPKWSPIFSQR
ncbi:MAG TPA: hypothetical protein VGM65_05335 [Candidatus Udaeobacter sp.]|jgi:ribosomal protein S9